MKDDSISFPLDNSNPNIYEYTSMVRVNDHTTCPADKYKHNIVKNDQIQTDEDHIRLISKSSDKNDKNQCKSSIQREISNLDTLREVKSSPKLNEIKRNLNLDLKNVSNNTVYTCDELKNKTNYLINNSNSDYNFNNNINFHSAEKVSN